MIGLAFATGWSPEVIRGLTLLELGEVAQVLKARKRAQVRASRKGRGHA